MKAIAFGEDGLAGDSGFHVDTLAVDLEKDETFDELVTRWMTLVAKEDFDIVRTGTDEWEGPDEDGKTWVLSRDELTEFVQEQLDLKPEGFWILEDEDLETVRALGAVECYNDSAAYTVNRCMKVLCDRLALRIVGDAGALRDHGDEDGE